MNYKIIRRKLNCFLKCRNRLLCGEVTYRLNREVGISLAEVARYLEVGALAIAMAIRKEESPK